MSDMDELAAQAAALDIALSDSQLDQFAAYRTMLIEWSESRNLTAILDPHQILIRHFLDSLTCAIAAGDLGGCRVIDVGTGAGLPGVPLKILYPDLELTLVDSLHKKTAFLQAVTDTLELSGVTVLTARAEELGQDPSHRETYDWAMARSVAKLSTLAEYLLPLVRVGGHALAQKGASSRRKWKRHRRPLRLWGAL